MPAPIEWINRLALQLDGFASRRVNTGQGRVHYLEGTGEGAHGTLVLLHGLGSSGVHFRHFLTRLRGTFSRILVPDFPGHGFSDAPRPLDVEKARAVFTEALDAIIDEPVTLYGNSMGGFASIQYAVERPDRIRALVLCSPGGAPNTDLDALLSRFRPQSHADALAFVDDLLARHYRSRHLIAFGARRSFARPVLQSLIDSMSPDALLDADALSQLRMPILFIWGEEERILPPANREFFLEHLPEHAQVLQPPEYGHCPHLEQPTRLSRQIDDFVVRSLGVNPVA